MKTIYKTTVLAATFAAHCIAFTPLFATDRALEAHEHGVSKLKLAQENNKIVFELEAPGKDIVEFEHAAENAEQKAAVAKALDQFKKPETIFAFPDAAKCKASDQHAEFETEGEHAGFHVTWTMTCDQPAKATSMSVRFFELFDHAEEVEVEAIGNAGQAAIEVENDQTTVDLSPAIGG